ncbi:MAG: nucleotidyltransferase family protein, partial [Clostridiales bacterium]|nr:nucleotidyltransferase family protein [Clostridiales bacterium]
IATRRYPKSSVQRILTRLLLGFDDRATACGAPPAAFPADPLGAANRPSPFGAPDCGPPYLRALGFNATGRRLLAEAAPNVPVVTNFARLRRAEPRAQHFTRLEARATDIYVAAFQNPRFRTGGQDFLRGAAVRV